MMKQTPVNGECAFDSRAEERAEKLRAISAGAYPLSAARTGQALIVARVSGRTVGERLAVMGVTPGTRVTVLCNAGGPMIIEVRGSRLSLGQGMARKILVKETE
ncbi:MAG TPA: FeoA family protein [bacterium]|nr:FeoA family protein [bacterium]